MREYITGTVPFIWTMHQDGDIGTFISLIFILEIVDVLFIFGIFELNNSS